MLRASLAGKGALSTMPSPSASDAASVPGGRASSGAVGSFAPDLRRVLDRATARATYDVLAKTIYGG